MEWKNLMKGIGILLLTIFVVTACGGGKALRDNYSNSVDESPTTLKSWRDFPPQVLTLTEAKKVGVFRVYGESADGQSHYDALAAARLVAQANLLTTIQGLKIEKNIQVKTDEGGKDFRGFSSKGGRLTEEDIKGTTTGYLKPYECGAYYDSSIGRGYYCVEVPFGK